MVNQIFVNLPVKDLRRSTDFFGKLGFSFNPKFTDENSACLVIGENIFAMLLVESFFQTFTKKEISDAGKTTEVLLAVQLESRDKVDQLMKKVVDAGGTLYRDPYEYDWMYGHSFADPDGHQWEVFYMDESKMPQPGR